MSACESASDIKHSNENNRTWYLPITSGLRNVSKDMSIPRSIAYSGPVLMMVSKHIGRADIDLSASGEKMGSICVRDVSAK